MSTPKQKADERPISFVLHNIAKDEDPIEFPLVIRPEDLTRTDQSRMTVSQTLGGAFLDNFGPGVPTVQISGHTGWGSGNRKDGLAEFKSLFSIIFERWHALRAEAIADNLDPDKVRLLFADKLDDFIWVVAPQTFVLRRSRSRPLLAQYQINLSFISLDIRETMDALAALKASEAGDAARREDAIDSLIRSLEKISDDVSRKLTSILGPAQRAVDRMNALTADVLDKIQRVVSGALQIPAAAAVQLLDLAAGLTKAATNAYHTIASIVALPLITKAYFMQVAAAFENAFCVLSNVLRPQLLLPNYDDLYGASNCSSTSGGRPLSIYDKINPFNVYVPAKTTGVVTINNYSAAELAAMGEADPVLAPMTMSQMAASLDTITGGVRVNLP